MQYVVGGTLTSDALEKVRQEGFVANRTGVPMIAVVVTDGMSRYPPLTRFQASLLRKENVLVYSIGKLYKNFLLCSYISIKLYLVYTELYLVYAEFISPPPPLKEEGEEGI